MRSAGGSAPRDEVEALTFLTAPGQVRVDVGDRSYLCAAAAGPDTCTVPLGPGAVRATVLRGGAPVAAVASPFAVTTTPYVQDLQYVSASSGRTPAAPAPAPATPQLVSETSTVAPTADTYANAGAPSTPYGTAGNLSSRGSTAAVSYLRFPVPAAPAGTVLSKAVLRLTTTTDPLAGSLDAHAVRLGASTWSETALTWGNRPLDLGAPVGTVAPGTLPRTAYDVPLAVDAVRGVLGRETVLTASSTGTDSLLVGSREGTAAARPQLVLTWTPVDAAAPSAPGRPTATATATGSSVAVTWAAAQDDVAVRGYELHRGASADFAPTAATRVAETSGTSATSPLPRPGSTWYRVVALDAAGNRSAASPAGELVVADTTAPACPARSPRRPPAARSP